MFIENQTVWCAMFGKGVVARINPKGVKFPVVVNFGGLMERCYSLDGRFEQLYATQPTLFTYPIEIVKKITKPSINWDHVRSEFKYLAQDADGSAWLYAEKPQINHSSHWSGVLGGHAKAESHATYDSGTCDWKDSLIERPTGNSGDD